METEFAGDTSYRVPISASLCLEDAIARPINIERPPAPRTQSLSGRDSRVSAWALSRTRRIIDVVAAAGALTVFLPVMGLAALAVRLGPPGPVLFKQERMGRDGLVFTLYKFRSMRTRAAASSPITVTGDNRITRIGAILRKYKLDELPQFWNVLRGDMSLVGPRPKLPHHEALHMSFRPGITGAATLAFRYEEEMLSRVPREHLDAYYERFVKPSKASIDLEYMQSATLKTDFTILWQTARSCFSHTETQYRAQLPEYKDAKHEFILPQTGSDATPSFSVGVV